MDEDKTRAIRLAITGHDGPAQLSDGEVEISQEIEDEILGIAQADSLDPVFRSIVAKILAIAIVNSVTPHAVLELLMENVPAAETWPRELLAETFNG